MLNCLATRWPNPGNFTSSYSTKPFRQTLTGQCWAVRPCSAENSSNCLVLIMHRQLGNYMLGTRESYGLVAQHICKTLHIIQGFTLTNRFLTYQGLRQPAALNPGVNPLYWYMLKNSVWLEKKCWDLYQPTGWILGRHQPPIPQHPEEYPKTFEPKQYLKPSWPKRKLFWHTQAYAVYYYQ